MPVGNTCCNTSPRTFAPEALPPVQGRPPPWGGLERGEVARRHLDARRNLESDGERGEYVRPELPELQSKKIAKSAKCPVAKIRQLFWAHHKKIFACTLSPKIVRIAIFFSRDLVTLPVGSRRSSKKKKVAPDAKLTSSVATTVIRWDLEKTGLELGRQLWFNRVGWNKEEE